MTQLYVDGQWKSDEPQKSHDAAAVLVSDITFQNGLFSGPGGGLSVLASDANITVQDCNFNENGTETETGGGLNVDIFGDGSIVVNNNNFIENTTDASGGGSEAGGGAYLFTSGGSISINGNFFQLNTASQGGGLYAENGTTLGSSIIVTNNILTQNTADFNPGGGMFLNSAQGLVAVTNNTFFNNNATDGVDGNGGGLAVQIDDSGQPVNIYNNIVFGNTAAVGGDDIWACGQGGLLNLFNNDFTQVDHDDCIAFTFAEGGNIPDDPQFVNSGMADFHLQATSPAIDTGDLAPPDGLPTPDFDGVTRPQGPLPDMGALEFQVIPTPTPTPTPIPTPTPLPSNPLLEGSGLLSCSFHHGLAMIPAQAWTGFLSLGACLGLLIVLRRKAR